MYGWYTKNSVPAPTRKLGQKTKILEIADQSVRRTVADTQFFRRRRNRHCRLAEQHVNKRQGMCSADGLPYQIEMRTPYFEYRARCARRPKGHFAHSAQKEDYPSLIVSSESDGVEEFVILLSVFLEKEAEVKQWPTQRTRLCQEQPDQEAAHPSVPILIGVNGLKLVVHQRRLNEDRCLNVFVYVPLELRHRFPHVRYRRRNKEGLLLRAARRTCEEAVEIARSLLRQDGNAPLLAHAVMAPPAGIAQRIPMATRPLRLGQSLVEAGRIKERHLRAALDEQQGSGRRLGDILVRRGYVDDTAVARALAAQLRLPFAEGPLIPEAEALELVDAALARTRAILPLSATDRILRLAVSDPLDQDTLEELRFSSGRRVEPIVAAPSAITEGIRTAYEGELAQLVKDLPVCDADLEDERTLRAAAAAAPVVRLVDHILQQAAALGVSDIHFEPFAGRILIRYRIDGVLRRSLTLPGSSLASIISRIKVMSGMDISIKRRPQDGGLTVEHAAGSLRIRASALPVAGGEKIVLRLLDPLKVPRNLDALGFSERDASLVRRLGQAGQGVILAAGPTGSGKSSSPFSRP